MEERREKFAAKGGVASTASISRHPEMEAERWSAEIAPVIKEVDEEVSLFEA